MNTAFMIAVAALHAGAAFSLLHEGKTALAVCFASYAIAGIAMIWVAK